MQLVLVEIGYVVLTNTNFAQYYFFKIPKFVLSEDPLYLVHSIPSGLVWTEIKCTMHVALL